LSDQYQAIPKAANMPKDLMHDDVYFTDTCDDEITTATHAQCNSPSSTTITTKINYNELVTTRKKIRENIEITASSGQQMQAIQVNKGRHWNGGENLPKDTVCTLKLSRDRNKIGIESLPVVITQVVYYSKMDQL
jgi:hypothetical protein